MAKKGIINKHVNNASELTRNLFDSDLEKAKGEIIISNDTSNPSIYILNNSGNITKISGGGSGGQGGSYDDTLIWNQVNENKTNIEELSGNTVTTVDFDAYKANIEGVISGVTDSLSGKVDTVVYEEKMSEIDEHINATTGLNESINTLNENVSGLTEDLTNISSALTETQNTVSTQGENIASNAESINSINSGITEINNIISGISDTLSTVNTTLETLNSDETVEGSVSFAVKGLKDTVDAYTINDVKISENPVLDTHNIKVSEEYSPLSVSAENIIPNDLISDALAKIEVMMANTTLCMTAALNDLDTRLGVPTEYDDKNKPLKKATGVYKLLDDMNHNMELLHPEVYNPVLSNGGNVTLYKAYRPLEPVVLKDTELNLNLNNQTIYAPTFTESNGMVLEGDTDSYSFWVKDNASLSIEGDGEVIARDAKYSMAIWAQGGTVEIKGGKFYNGGDGCDLIYASAGGKVYIYGGEFHATERSEEVSGTKNKFSALNIKDVDRGISQIKVYGGKFYGFNPANNLSEGPNTNFVAEGYESIEIEPNVWEVCIIK